MSAAHGGGGARAATPHRAAPRAIAPWGASPGAIPDLSVARFHANDASLANVFEATQDDWEQDSLWAAMEEAVGNPGFRGGVHGSFAEDPASILPPLSALKPAAPPQEALAAHEPAPRERFERIEVRARDARRAAPPPHNPPPIERPAPDPFTVCAGTASCFDIAACAASWGWPDPGAGVGVCSCAPKKKKKPSTRPHAPPQPPPHHQERINDLETRLAAAQDAARLTPSPPASADPPSNTAPGLFVHTRERPGDHVARDPPASGSGGKSPQSPSPLARRPRTRRGREATARRRANARRTTTSPSGAPGSGSDSAGWGAATATATSRRPRREARARAKTAKKTGPREAAAAARARSSPRRRSSGAWSSRTRASPRRRRARSANTTSFATPSSTTARNPRCSAKANARYEARVAQLECMVRAAAAAGSNRGGDHAQQALGSSPIAPPRARGEHDGRGGERGVNAMGGAEGRGRRGDATTRRGGGEEEDHPAGGSRAGSEERGRGAGGRPPAGDSSSPTASGVEGGRA